MQVQNLGDKTLPSIKSCNSHPIPNPTRVAPRLARRNVAPSTLGGQVRVHNNAAENSTVPLLGIQNRQGYVQVVALLRYGIP
jgi:hypothetical protein